MHESSSLTLVYKYLLPLMLGASMLGLFFIPADSFNESSDDIVPVLLVFGCVMIWMIIFSVRLKRVTAQQSHLTIRSFNGDKKIDYKDIEYVSEAALVNPRVITLKYKESRTGESDIILIMPSTTSEMFRFKFLQEHDMTLYIRGQIMAHNPFYSTDREPSRWQVLGYVMGTMLVAALLGALAS